jgi:Cft2 family RNA processing exonuclease
VVEIGWYGGVVVSTNKGFIRFDSKTKGKVSELNFISHAHGDHIFKFNSKTQNYSTKETRDIINKRKEQRIENIKTMNYSEKIGLDGIEIKAYNAGHMLGSTLFEIQTQGTTIIYTGDFNCIDTLTTKAAEERECDILIIESTYGKPNYILPKREEIYVSIFKWVLKQIKSGRTPVFRVYTAGKAQEIIRLVNLFTKIPVITHPRVTIISDVYKKNGINIDYLDSETNEGKKILGKNQGVYVIPSQFKKIKVIDGVDAIVSGWALRYRPQGTASFPLSGHADFGQLVEYIKRTNPKIVYTIHGFKEEFAKFVSHKVGIHAEPITPLIQKRIKDFF